MSKNTVNLNGKLVYAVVVPFKGDGEPKVILHEARVNASGFEYAFGDTWITNTEAVTRIDKEESDGQRV